MQSGCDLKDCKQAVTERMHMRLTPIIIAVMAPMSGGLIYDHTFLRGFSRRCIRVGQWTFG